MQETALFKRLSELGDELALPPKSEVLWIDDHCFMRIARFAADNLEGSRCLLVGPQACLNAIERTRRPAERKRSAVFSKGEIPSRMGRKGLGRPGRLKGQNRVPLPPAKITA